LIFTSSINFIQPAREKKAISTQPSAFSQDFSLTLALSQRERDGVRAPNEPSSPFSRQKKSPERGFLSGDPKD
jgi:hypothetical protein